MKPHDLMVGLVWGCVLLALGLIPGLFSSLTEGVQNAIRVFRDSVLFGSPVTPQPRSGCESPHRPLWLAGLGALLITITILAYFWN